MVGRKGGMLRKMERDEWRDRERVEGGSKRRQRQGGRKSGLREGERAQGGRQEG